MNRLASGCLFGMAFGDSLGFKTEFLYFQEILDRFPPDKNQGPYANPRMVTDDTQMALAVGEALLVAERPYTAATLEQPLRQAFIKWANSPDNDRAPGMTCLTACANLTKYGDWRDATVANSKGCGANMRVAPVGLLFDGVDGVTATTRAAIAQFQAALTHGHATALAASDLTAATVAYLVSGGDPADLPGYLRAYALSQQTVYHAGWLGDLWQRPGITSPEDFISRGWAECLTVLDNLDTALGIMDRSADPCLITGAGWIAEEAFATGLLCFLMYPNDPVAAIRRAAISSGDSDSIACLTGAFAGAHCGLDAWPPQWSENIEYRDRLLRLSAAWD